MRRQRRRVQAQGLDRRQRRAQVAAVVPARQRQARGYPARIVRRDTASLSRRCQPSASLNQARAWSRARSAPTRRGSAALSTADARHAPAVTSASLSCVVARFAAVPVEVLGEEVQHHRDFRRASASPRLVAGQLDDPELRRRLDVEQLQQRQADVADQRGALAGRAQQVRDQRGRRALALGAGDADRCAAPRVLAEPQRGAADEARALQLPRPRAGDV